jgi:hypothetical protein
VKVRSTARACGVLLFTVLATVVVQRLVAAPLRSAVAHLADVAAGRDPAPLGVGGVVLVGSALALVGCWLWLVAGVLAGVVSCLVDGREVATARAARLRALLGPRWVHGLTAAAIGVTLAQGPAAADTGGERAAPPWSTGLSGLPLPDRAVAGPATPAARAYPRTRSARPADPVVTVHAGDSLWSIAAALLPPDAPDAAVDAAWRRIAAVNAAVLGADPDLIFPGTALRVPAPHEPREETP